LDGAVFSYPKARRSPVRKKPLALLLATSAVALPGKALAAEGDDTKPINPERIWQQRWSKATEGEQAWAYSTGSCESGNNPGTNTGNGFLGAFQYVPSTWWSAPNTGGGVGNAHQLPHEESWKTQAVVSIKLMRRDGTGHWPVCGV
jgi:Transglycosylase-like domain